MSKSIGNIGNYYGSLNVKKEGEKFFWGIENWDGFYWEEISEALYNALLKHDRAVKRKQKKATVNKDEP